MKLGDKRLNEALKDLQQAQNHVLKSYARITEHCLEVYGAEPSDLDCDNFLDCCGGLAGRVVPGSYTAKKLESDMRQAFRIKGLDTPNRAKG